VLAKITRTIVATSALTTLALCITACGDGSGDATASAADTSEQPTTTAEVTTTTVETTVPDEMMVSIEALQGLGPTAPLTGAPTEEGTDLDHPALAVKIDNHVDARRYQTALDQADLVFDLRAEGVTRFMAVFHSQIPDTVGPVRSSRTSDFDLLRGLDNPLYASSGGNANVMGGVGSLPVQAVTNHTRGEYYRGPGTAPHNLYVDPPDLFALARSDEAPSPWFDYRGADQALPSSAVEASERVTVDFTDTPTVGLEWSDERAGWLRTQDGSPHVTADGEQLAPENVVIMITTYGVSSADASSPEVRSTGTGPALVLTDGHLIEATWHRSSPTDKPTLLDEDGDDVLLTPGQTWVLYPEAGQVDAGEVRL
jgi:hypothetical protein